MENVGNGLEILKSKVIVGFTEWVTFKEIAKGENGVNLAEIFWERQFQKKNIKVKGSEVREWLVLGRKIKDDNMAGVSLEREK